MSSFGLELIEKLCDTKPTERKEECKKLGNTWLNKYLMQCQFKMTNEAHKCRNDAKAIENHLTRGLNTIADANKANGNKELFEKLCTKEENKDVQTCYAIADKSLNSYMLSCQNKFSLEAIENCRNDKSAIKSHIMHEIKQNSFNRYTSDKTGQIIEKLCDAKPKPYVEICYKLGQDWLDKYKSLFKDKENEQATESFITYGTNLINYVIGIIPNQVNKVPNHFYVPAEASLKTHMLKCEKMKTTEEIAACKKQPYTSTTYISKYLEQDYIPQPLDSNRVKKIFEKLCDTKSSSKIDDCYKIGINSLNKYILSCQNKEKIEEISACSSNYDSIESQILLDTNLAMANAQVLGATNYGMQ